MDAMYKFFSKLASIGSDKYLHMIAGLIVSMVVCRGRDDGSTIGYRALFVVRKEVYSYELFRTI